MKIECASHERYLTCQSLVARPTRDKAAWLTSSQCVFLASLRPTKTNSAGPLILADTGLIVDSRASGVVRLLFAYVRSASLQSCR
jgi:hypothetical protein